MMTCAPKTLPFALCIALFPGLAAAGEIKIEFRPPMSTPLATESLLLSIAASAPAPDAFPSPEDSLVVAPFHSLDAGNPATQTRATIACDGENLFVSFYCVENAGPPKATHNLPYEDIFNDDSVSVYLDPSNTGQNVICFAANARGASYAAASIPSLNLLAKPGGLLQWSWLGRNSGVWTAQSQPIEDGWSVSFRIPATAVTGRNTILPGETLRIGFQRNRYGRAWPARAKATAFAATARNIPPLRPMQMGTAQVAMNVLDPGARLPGENQARVEFINNTAEAATIQLQTILVARGRSDAPGGETAIMDFSLDPGARETRAASYFVPWETRSCVLRLRLINAADKRELAVQDFPRLLTAAPLAARLDGNELVVGDILKARMAIMLGNLQLREARLLAAIRDAAGNEVARAESSCAAEKARLRFDTAALAPGQYRLVLQLQTIADKSFTESLIFTLQPPWVN